MMDPILTETNLKIQKALDHLKYELSTIRAGRANPTLIENVPVKVYGSLMKLIEVGTISAPQPTLLTVSIWDASIISDVHKSLLEANLGLNPSIDGQTIRLPVPPLTEERRLEYAKTSHQKGEHTKVEIRRIRGEQRNDWLKLKESGEIGEDEFFRREKLLQDFIDKSTVAIDEMIKTKREELTTL